MAWCGTPTHTSVQVTGGGATFSVRGAYQAETQQMPFKAKLMIVFNENNMPKVDVEDHAFWKRLLLIEHRSLFCSTSALYRQKADEPYTFQAEQELKARVERNAVLAWMLEGTERFKAEGKTPGDGHRVTFACRWTHMQDIQAG